MTAAGPRYAGAPPMDVALALFRWFPHGGMQRDAVATARRCVAAGHRVTFYCHTWEGPHPEDCAVEVLPSRALSNHGRALRFAAALSQRLRAALPDVVLGFDKLPDLDLYFAADPCFVARTARRPWPYRLTPRYRAFAGLERAVFAPPTTTRILLLDPGQRADYERAWRTPPERFVILPPGIARDRCAGPDAAALRAAGRREFDLAQDDRLLLLVASNPRLKGLDRAIAGIAALPPDLRRRTRLAAVGGGADARLRALAARRSDAARVLLLPPRDDVPRLLQAADLLVHPARADTTGTVLLEAIVAGLPVLCSAACGYAQHVAAAGAGRVVAEPFAQPDYDAALRELLAADPGPLRRRALDYAARHDLHGMHDRLLAELERCGREAISAAAARLPAAAPAPTPDP